MKKSNICQVRALRKHKDLTQGALAAKAGVNIRLIQKLESGETDIMNLTLGNALAIAGALDAAAEDLIEWPH